MKKNKHRLLKVLIFSAACAGALHLINRVIHYVATNKGASDGDDLLTYEWANGPVRYIKKGEGSPILLIHHIDPFASSYEWHSVISDLAKKHTVYALDLPGCGHSVKEPVTYVAFYFVQMLEAFLRDVVGEKAVLVASGSSAAVASAAAAFDSSLIDRLVLVNPRSDTRALDADWKQKLFINLLKLPILGTFIYNLRFNRAHLDADLADNLFYNPFNVTSDLVDTGFANVHLGNDNGRYLYASQIGGYMDVDPKLALERISVPVLYMIGSKAPTRESAEKWVELSGSPECIKFNRSATFPHIEEAEVFIEQIERFLKSESASADESSEVYSEEVADEPSEVSSEELSEEPSEEYSEEIAEEPSEEIFEKE